MPSYLKLRFHDVVVISRTQHRASIYLLKANNGNNKNNLKNLFEVNNTKNTRTMSMTLNRFFTIF